MWPGYWRWQAKDDLGNEYTDAGGVFGLSRDGRTAEGELSFVPAPPLDASSVQIILDPWAESKTRRDPCVFDVHLRASSGESSA
jgi:hypothetical protein